LLQCQVSHADETPVAMLAPGKGKTHRAYPWACTAAVSENIMALVYDFTEGRSWPTPRWHRGRVPRRRRAGWRDRTPSCELRDCRAGSGQAGLFRP
jgi:hypothetical protein